MDLRRDALANAIHGAHQVSICATRIVVIESRVHSSPQHASTLHRQSLPLHRDHADMKRGLSD